MKICLVMVAKAERDVFKRCLDSVRSLIDSAVVIVDPGDGQEYTQRLKEICGDGVHCYVREYKWNNISDSRNAGFATAKLLHPESDYYLIMDADDYLEGTDSTALFQQLSTEQKDTYELEIVDGNQRYFRPQILKADLPYLRYTGSFHEYVTHDKPVTLVGKVDGLRYIRTFETLTKEQLKKKYDKFINGLTIDHHKNPTDARTVYYLAQSYKDAGSTAKAIHWYEKRSHMTNGWDEERWSAMYEVGLLCANMIDNSARDTLVTGAFLKAWQFRPNRIEPLFQLARYFRISKQFNLAYMFGHHGWALITANPNGSPFDTVVSERWLLDRTIYRWKLVEEVAIAAFYVGQRGQSLSMFSTLAANAAEWGIPQEDLERIHGNLKLFM